MLGDNLAGIDNDAKGMWSALRPQKDQRQILNSLARAGIESAYCIAALPSFASKDHVLERRVVVEYEKRRASCLRGLVRRSLNRIRRFSEWESQRQFSVIGYSGGRAFSFCALCQFIRSHGTETKRHQASRGLPRRQLMDEVHRQEVFTAKSGQIAPPSNQVQRSGPL